MQWLHQNTTKTPLFASRICVSGSKLIVMLHSLFLYWYVSIESLQGLMSTINQPIRVRTPIRAYSHHGRCQNSTFKRHNVFRKLRQPTGSSSAMGTLDNMWSLNCIVHFDGSAPLLYVVRDTKRYRTTFPFYALTSAFFAFSFATSSSPYSVSSPLPPILTNSSGSRSCAGTSSLALFVFLLWSLF